MRKGTGQSRTRRQVEEDDHDDHDQKPSWMVPGSPDYLAVKVLVVEGRCAQRVDKKGNVVSDPDVYVRLSYYGSKWETQVLRNNTAPKWNETFEVPIPLGTRPCRVLLLRAACGRDRREYPSHRLQTDAMHWASWRSRCGTCSTRRRRSS
jgi:hypothetical protein